MRSCVEVLAPSRLHFGMLSFGQPGVRQFGGLGAMIQSPGVHLRIVHSQRLKVRAPPELAQRIEQHVERLAASWGLWELPHCTIEIVEPPRQHIGLGSGTQLAMSVAVGLQAFFEQPFDNPQQLAQAVGRGRRSAIGLYGFLFGGLLLEGGKLQDDEISPLIARMPLPEGWRFVLMQPRSRIGLHGEQERLAFAQLPAVPLELTSELCREALLHVLPAAATSEFAEFSESLFRFGQRAGECFKTQQAGAFATRASARLVQLLRDNGVRGVGQTSWGPTLFAVVENNASAESLTAWLAHHPECAEVELSIAAPCNSGAIVRDVC